MVVVVVVLLCSQLSLINGNLRIIGVATITFEFTLGNRLQPREWWLLRRVVLTACLSGVFSRWCCGYHHLCQCCHLSGP